MNRAVISPLLFRLSVAFSSKPRGSQKGPLLLYSTGQETKMALAATLGPSRSQAAPCPTSHPSNCKYTTKEQHLGARVEVLLAIQSSVKQDSLQTVE